MKRTLLIIVWVVAHAAQAAVKEEHAQRPYAVHIQPGQTLRRALNAATPISVNGRRFYGFTHWNVRWNFRWWREASGRCRITAVTTQFTTEMQLPELYGATAAQQAKFNRFLDALLNHEQGHVQLGRDAAHAIDKGIAALPQAPDCATLERNANTLGHRLVQEYTAYQRDYDRETNHGTTQGAVTDP